MRLPNFLISDEFIRLKEAMGIPPDKLGKLRAIEVRCDGVTPTEGKFIEGEGLEVDIRDVVPLPDNTLAYKNRRILLYIRDISQNGGNYSDPRFHIADCQTLRQMRAYHRDGRYVISSRDDGLFELHYIDSGRKIDKRLFVCQHCLDSLNYEGFQLRMRESTRQTAVVRFSIAAFFADYPKTLHHFMPIHTDQTAPTNDYSPDFPSKSRAYRQERNWICETCGIPLSEDAMQRYLHVHHINGLKNDNRDENLKAVCVHCHALEPLHGHVSAMLQYRQFEPIWQRWQKTGVLST